MQTIQLFTAIKYQVRTCCLVALVLLCSCSGLKPLASPDKVQPLRTTTLAKLNGDYAIISTDTSYRTLEYALSFRDYFDMQHLPASKDYVRLTTVSPGKIKATVYTNGVAGKSKTLRGQVKENYFWFSIKRFSSIVPLYVLLNKYQVQKGRMGLLPDGNLTLDVKSGGVLLVVLFPVSAAGGELYNLVFKRLSPVP